MLCSTVYMLYYIASYYILFSSIYLCCIYFQTERQGKSVDRMDVADTRQWTVKHLDAANIPHNSQSALTPPQGEDNMQTVIDVNVRGPGECLLILINHCGKLAMWTLQILPAVFLFSFTAHNQLLFRQEEQTRWQTVFILSYAM